MSAELEPRFSVFLSYSHRDARSARQLSRWIESYRTPASLVGAAGALGPVGHRIGRVFRDDEELGASHNLGERIEQALASSGSLLVLCSPEAAASHWVRREIARFRELHPDRPIFAAIVRRDEANELALPPELTAAAPGDEPLAIDFTALDREVAHLKIMSGLLGVDFDLLYRRERRRTVRRIALATTGASAIAIVLAASAVVAALQARRATANADLAQRSAQIADVQRDRALRSQRLASSERDRAQRSEQRARQALQRSIASEALAERSAAAARDSAARAVRSAVQARIEQQAAERARSVALDALNRTALRLADDRYREDPALAALQRDVLSELMPVYDTLLADPDRDPRAATSYAAAVDGLARLQADWTSVEQANAAYNLLVATLSTPDLMGDPQLAELRDRIALRHVAVLVSYGDGELARAGLATLSAPATRTAEGRCLRFATQMLLAGDPIDPEALRDDARDAAILASAGSFEESVTMISCALGAAESYAINNEFDDAFTLSDTAEDVIARVRERYPSSITVAALSAQRRLAEIDLIRRAANLTDYDPAAPSDIPTRRELPTPAALPAFLRDELNAIERELDAAAKVAPDNRRLLEARFLIQLWATKYDLAGNRANQTWLDTAQTLIQRDPSSRVIAERLSAAIMEPLTGPNVTEQHAIAACENRVAQAERLHQALPAAYAAQRMLTSSYACLGTVAVAYPARTDLMERYLGYRERIDAAWVRSVEMAAAGQSGLRLTLLERNLDRLMASPGDWVAPYLAELDRESTRFPDALRYVAQAYLLRIEAAAAASTRGDLEGAQSLLACPGRSEPQRAVCTGLYQEVGAGTFGPELANAAPPVGGPAIVIGWVTTNSPSTMSRADGLKAFLRVRHNPVELFVTRPGGLMHLTDLTYSRAATSPALADTLDGIARDTRETLQRAVAAGIDLRRAYWRLRLNEPLSEREETLFATALRSPPATRVADDRTLPGATGRIGVEVNVVDGVLVLTGLEPGRPAERAGLTVDDRVIAVDGIPTYGVEGMIDRVAGAPGTAVTLSVMRTGLRQPMTVTIVRERIPQAASEPETANSAWQSSAFNREAEPIELTEDLLNEKVVILLQGKNIYGDQIYTYLQMTLHQLQALRDKMRAQEDFMPAEYGTVLAAGRGVPSRRTRRWLAQVHNMVDVPRVGF